MVLQEKLQNYVNVDQTDWVDHSSMVEFDYNNLNIREQGSAHLWWFLECNHYLL